MIEAIFPWVITFIFAGAASLAWSLAPNSYHKSLIFFAWMGILFLITAISIAGDA